MAKAIPISELPVFSASNLPSREADYSAGAIFLINKPLEWSSFHVVKLVRNRTKVKKVGHAGTLDPLATGLLVVCLGKATKSIDQIQQLSKEYRAEITFGGATASYDAAEEVSETAPCDHITRELCEDVLNRDFNGEILQKPPMFSAIKKDGKRLYKLARKGETVEIEPRSVEIYGHEVHAFESPVLDVSIRCSKGTYIRSIAHDLGKSLDSLGYLSALERTKIGDYSVEDALSIDMIKEIWS